MGPATENARRPYVVSLKRGIKVCSVEQTEDAAVTRLSNPGGVECDRCLRLRLRVHRELLLGQVRRALRTPERPDVLRRLQRLRARIHAPLRARYQVETQRLRAAQRAFRLQPMRLDADQSLNRSTG